MLTDWRCNAAAVGRAASRPVRFVLHVPAREEGGEGGQSVRSATPLSLSISLYQCTHRIAFSGPAPPALESG